MNAMLLFVVFLTLCFTPGKSLPPSYKYDVMDNGDNDDNNDNDDDDLTAFDYDRAADEMDDLRKRSSVCDEDECVPDRCHPAQGCRAGLVTDTCGCCSECGNVEGQQCDPGGRNVYYGVCGEGLECKSDGSEELVCVCVSQVPVCGSDGHTYSSPCTYREAVIYNPGLNATEGPCNTVPVIKVPPRNLVNVSGSSAVFLCEVFAFPMALVEWRKEGKEVVLPGDDPHISVQSRGGPQKYELSSWLQIEDATRADSGTYRCIAKNSLGSVSATAVLGILPPDEMSAYLEESMKELMGYDPIRDYDGDYY